jgi:putative acetyltransferase
MGIQLDERSSPEIQELLRDPMDAIGSVSPPESRHALNLNGLRRSDITFWSMRIKQRLTGCVALTLGS